MKKNGCISSVVLVLFIIVLSAFFGGCGGNGEKQVKSKKSQESASTCANVIQMLLDQRFRYQNEKIHKLDAFISISGPTSGFVLDWQTSEYSKKVLKDSLKEMFRSATNCLSDKQADQLAEKMADLNELTQYTITPTGNTVKHLDGRIERVEDEYHIINVKFKHPDIKMVHENAQRRLLETFHAKGKCQRLSIDASKNLVGSSNGNKLGSSGALADIVGGAFGNDHSKQMRKDVGDCVFRSYMSELENQDAIPCVNYNVEVCMRGEKEKNQPTRYFIADKSFDDNHPILIFADIWDEAWRPRLAISSHDQTNKQRDDMVVVSLPEGKFQGMELNQKVIIVPYKMDEKIEKSQQRTGRGEMYTLAYLSLNLGWYVENKTDETIRLNFTLIDDCGTSYAWSDWKGNADSKGGKASENFVDTRGIIIKPHEKGTVYVELHSSEYFYDGNYETANRGLMEPWHKASEMPQSPFSLRIRNLNEKMSCILPLQPVPVGK